MKNLPTLRQMQYLLALSDRMSFHRAAEDCNVTQSTLSGGLRDMETILQSPVIDRSSRKQVRFTPLGKEIIEQARGIVAKMEELTFRAQSQNKPLAWPLKMGVIPTIAPYLLPRRLKPLQEKLPALDLHLHEIRSRQLLDKINDGSLDFGLMAFPYDTGDLETKVVFEEEFWCAAPPHYFKNKKTLRLEDLQDEKLLLLEDGHCVRDHALEACKLQPIKEMKSLSAASLSTLIQMVHEGYGVTLLPEMAVSANPMLPANLTLRRFSRGAPIRQIGFVWNRDSLRAADIALVVRELGRLMKIERYDQAA
jgi:LysR family hydrogen peroxide-inducible transcriptional activator